METVERVGTRLKGGQLGVVGTTEWAKEAAVLGVATLGVVGVVASLCLGLHPQNTTTTPPHKTPLFPLPTTTSFKDCCTTPSL